jgi:hypothetical protein
VPAAAALAGGTATVAARRAMRRRRRGRRRGAMREVSGVACRGLGFGGVEWGLVRWRRSGARGRRISTVTEERASVRAIFPFPNCFSRAVIERIYVRDPGSILDSLLQPWLLWVDSPLPLWLGQEIYNINSQKKKNETLQGLMCDIFRAKTARD